MIHRTADIILTVPATPMPLAAFKADFLGMYASPVSSPATRAKLEQIFRILEGLGTRTTDQLDTNLVARFIASRPAGQSPHTTRGLLIQLRTVCSYAESRRLLSASPFRIRRLSRWVRVGPPAGVRHQSAEEIRRVLDLMRSDAEARRGWAQWRARRLYALTATVAYTGLRAGEAQRLWVQDIDLAAGVINLVPRTATGRLKTEASAQPVCLPRALKPILEGWLPHRLDCPRDFEMPPAGEIPWMFPGAGRTCAWTSGESDTRPVGRLKAAAARAGVEGMTFQSLRRSWATHAEALGVPQAMITRQCRHASEATTRRWYQQRDMDSLKGAVEGFDF